jgi:hypothetical protein
MREQIYNFLGQAHEVAFLQFCYEHNRMEYYSLNNLTHQFHCISFDDFVQYNDHCDSLSHSIHAQSDHQLAVQILHEFHLFDEESQ